MTSRACVPIDPVDPRITTPRAMRPGYVPDMDSQIRVASECGGGVARPAEWSKCTFTATSLNYPNDLVKVVPAHPGSSVQMNSINEREKCGTKILELAVLTINQYPCLKSPHTLCTRSKQNGCTFLIVIGNLSWIKVNRLENIR